MKVDALNQNANGWNAAFLDLISGKSHQTDPPETAPLD